MADVYGLDAYSPKEIAERVENIGVTKANLPFLQMAVLGVLAGGFIGLGALFSTLVTSDPTISFATGRVMGGVAFSLGLILVVVAGAELFTGNNLLTMAWAGGRISTGKLVRNLAIIYAANLVGALGLTAIVVWSHHADMNGGLVGQNAIKIAAYKASLPFGEAFFKGILCNVLVCLAVWLAMAGRHVIDKIPAIVFPVTAFVAAGFEHSIANMYFIPLGIFLRHASPTTVVPHIEDLNWMGFLHNQLPVTLGNMVGGGGMVALVYFVIYRRGVSNSR